MRLRSKMRYENQGLLTAIVICLSLSGLNAQQTSVSPYSIFGNGESNPGYFAQHIGVGGWTAAFRDPLQVNLSNPASYSALKYASIELGGFFHQSAQSDESGSSLDNTGGLGYLGLGFGLMDGWGMSIAMLPYSQMGYDVRTMGTVQGFGGAEFGYTGEGGFDRVVIGQGIELYKGLSIGINGSFLFGSTERKTSVIFDEPQFYNTRREESIRTTGFTWDAGLQYVVGLAPENRTELVIGGSYTPLTRLQGRMDDFYYTYTVNSLGNEIPRDTINNVSGRETDVVFNSHWSAGLSIGGKHDQLDQYAWSAGAEFRMFNRSELNDSDTRGTFTNGWRASAGGRIIPLYVGNQSQGTYLSRIDYRLGGFYERSGLVLGSQNIDDYGISVGFGLPLGRRIQSQTDVKLAMLNLGMIFGNRGTVSDGNIREQYARIVVGLTLNDKWFTQFKYR